MLFERLYTTPTVDTPTDDDYFPVGTSVQSEWTVR